VLVYVPEELQRKRLKLRDGFSDLEIQKRLDAQMDIEKKRTLATYIIDNSGSESELRSQVLQLN
jgi:dephospho-CoA kinase